MNQSNLHQIEKRAQLGWTAFILMFFLMQAIIWTFAISITSQDGSHAVVAGYDQQALHWDEVKKMRRESDELGWQTEFILDPSAEIGGNRKLTLQISDRDGVPVSNLTVSIDAFHRGRASDVQHITLKGISPGVYAGEVLIFKLGKWQFTGIATNADQKYLLENQVTANKATALRKPSSNTTGT